MFTIFPLSLLDCWADCEEKTNIATITASKQTKEICFKFLKTKAFIMLELNANYDFKLSTIC